jgi:hypothetical protein
LKGFEMLRFGIQKVERKSLHITRRDEIGLQVLEAQTF